MTHFPFFGIGLFHGYKPI